MDSAAIEISVVIACKNEEHHIGTMLESLAQQSWNGSWEVVVADNGSTDRTREVVRSFQDRLPRLLVVDASNARGYALARNAGVAHSSGAKLLFVDADDAVNEGYVGAMASALDDTGLVCARAGFDRLNARWVIDIWPARWQQEEPIRLLGFLPFAGGGTLGIRRSLFEEVDGFRQRRPSSQFEEADLCWRIQLAGHPAPVLIHSAVLEYRLPTRLKELYRRGRDYARGQRTLYTLYAEHGMPRPSDVAVRDVAGALRRTRSRRDLARTANTLGRLVGQHAGPAVD